MEAQQAVLKVQSVVRAFIASKKAKQRGTHINQTPNFSLYSNLHPQSGGLCFVQKYLLNLNPLKQTT